MVEDEPPTSPRECFCPSLLTADMAVRKGANLTLELLTKCTALDGPLFARVPVAVFVVRWCGIGGEDTWQPSSKETTKMRRSSGITAGAAAHLMLSFARWPPGVLALFVLAGTPARALTASKAPIVWNPSQARHAR